MDNSSLPPSPQPSNPPVTPPSPPLAPPPMRPPPPLPRTRREGRGTGWRLAAIILAILLAVSLLSHIGSFLSALAGGAGGTIHKDGARLEEVTLEHHRSSHKIVVVPIEGVIFSEALGGYTLVQHVKDQLKLAGRDERVKAVILKVNSPGGEVLASDDINRAIAEFQAKHKKPVIAAMGSLAASGGYYVSAPCRWIVANELTITGSIGVIMHSWNYRGLMNKVGLTPQVYKSGRFKDMLSPERDLEKMTPQERADFEEESRMIQKVINETYEKFKTVVAQGRREANRLNQGNKDPGRPLAATWAEFADGRILSGKEAHELGFVDELGSWDAAVSRARQLAGISDANLVTYQQLFDLASFFRLLGRTDAATVKVDWGVDLPKLQPGLLYFLSPTYVR